MGSKGCIETYQMLMIGWLVLHPDNFYAVPKHHLAFTALSLTVFEECTAFPKHLRIALHPNTLFPVHWIPIFLRNALRSKTLEDCTLPQLSRMHAFALLFVQRDPIHPCTLA